MEDILIEFRNLLDVVPGQLGKIDEAESARRPGPAKWSKKEILGHLIDSAANNHQRFIRAQFENPLAFPAYAQEAWVETNGYQQTSWRELVALWAAYNRHLARVMARIPPEKLSHSCRIGDSPPVTLEFLVRDYVRHLEHHLGQLLA